ADDGEIRMTDPVARSIAAGSPQRLEHRRLDRRANVEPELARSEETGNRRVVPALDRGDRQKLGWRLPRAGMERRAARRAVDHGCEQARIEARRLERLNHGFDVGTEPVAR